MDLKSFFEEKMKVLFLLSHSKSIKLRIQVLKLIFFMSRSLDQNTLDKYYQSLYEIVFYFYMNNF